MMGEKPSGDVEALAVASMEMVVEQLERIAAVLRAGPMVRSQDMRSAVADLGIVADMAKHLFPTLPSAYRSQSQAPAPKE